MAFYTCPYCDGTEETPVSSAFHVCDQNKVKDKIKALEDKNTELLAALKVAERYFAHSAKKSGHECLELETIRAAIAGESEKPNGQ